VTRVTETRIDFATPADAAAITAMRTAVAEHLTREHGQGHWSSAVSEKNVARALQPPRNAPTSRILVARRGKTIVGTAHLVTKKPWAIDVSYFTQVPKALYLVDMAVAPDQQRQGLGRRIVDEVLGAARAWPAQAIRLDAYDHAAGAGQFYAKCGFREVGRATFRGAPLLYYEWVLG